MFLTNELILYIIYYITVSAKSHCLESFDNSCALMLCAAISQNKTYVNFLTYIYIHIYKNKFHGKYCIFIMQLKLLEEFLELFWSQPDIFYFKYETVYYKIYRSRLKMNNKLKILQYNGIYNERQNKILSFIISKLLYTHVFIFVFNLKILIIIDILNLQFQVLRIASLWIWYFQVKLFTYKICIDFYI